MTLSDYIQRARNILNHQRTPEGSLLLNRDEAIDLLVFLQNTQDAAKYLEDSMNKKEDCGLADMEDASANNNVVRLFPNTKNSTNTPDLRA